MTTKRKQGCQERTRERKKKIFDRESTSGRRRSVLGRVRPRAGEDCDEMNQKPKNHQKKINSFKTRFIISTKPEEGGKEIRGCVRAKKDTTFFCLKKIRVRWHMGGHNLKSTCPFVGILVIRKMPSQVRSYE